MYCTRFSDIICSVFVMIGYVERSKSRNISDLNKYNDSRIIDLDFNTQQKQESGSQDFNQVSQTKLFIDKTLLIREIFCHKSLIISAPRHFGKTLNLNMLNLFLSNSKKIEDVKNTFYGTKIWSHHDFVRGHCCTYPVLFCSFHTYIEVINLESLLRSFKYILLNVFYKHFYLNSSNKLDKDKKQMFAKYIKENKNLTVSEVKNGLRVLSRLMCLHHSKTVTILIDDYDEKILNNLFDVHYKPKEKEKEQLRITKDIVKFHADILCDLLSDTDFVERIIISGILNINICKHYVNKLNLEHRGFLQDNRFSKYFGFTREDLVKLVFKFRLNRDERCELTEWYETYTSKFGVMQVFNPLSVSEFLMVRSGNSFWTDTKPLRMLGILPLLDNNEILNNFIKIANNTEIAVKSKDKFSIEDLIILKKTSENWWDEHTDIDLFFHLMLQMGYLTYSVKDFSDVSNSNLLKVPNREVRKEIVLFLFEYLDVKNMTQPDILDY